MDRAIEAFHQDDAGDWLVELSCGHRRHVRHDPPLSERPWVLDPAERESRLGTPLDCGRCRRSQMPRRHAPYRQTPEFDECSVPDALRKRHTTRAGVWARIHVTRGALEYHVHGEDPRVEQLTPDRPGTVVPEVEHHVETPEPVTFLVEFWRAATETED